MAAFKNKDNGTWYVQFRYTDWQGNRQQKFKRGFATKREALEWEREFLLKKQADIDMTFESFAQLYEKDIKPKLKLNTWLTKESIIQKKILPYFRKRKLSEITARDVIDWQNEIRSMTDSKGKPYSSTYLKTVHNQLSAIFNHAVRYYGLQVNPAARAGNMGTEERREMLFWTQEEYRRFADAMMDKPLSYYAFEMLYWCGIREGELLALTPADFDFSAGTVSINKTYNRLRGQDVITSPKTKKSNRIIKMPQFLCDEMQDYLKMFYSTDTEARIFPVRPGVKPSIREQLRKHQGVQRLVDIEAKRAAGKGIGYERWAKTFNLKQEAAALMVYQQHGFSSLEEMEAALSASYADLLAAQASLRKVEDELKAKTELRGHLLSYRRGQPLRNDWKALPAGKKREAFRRQHESAFIIMDADVSYFKAHGLTKLPPVKTIQAEIEALIEEKNRLYVAYREQKQQAKELQTVRDNIRHTLSVQPKKQRDAER